MKECNVLVVHVTVVKTRPTQSDTCLLDLSVTP